MDSVFSSSGGVEAVPVFLIGIIVLALLVIVPLKLLIACMIFHKTGHSWTLGLLMLVPIVNILMIFVLAFGDWPVRRELRQLRQLGT
ncbi:MAG: hypothetical protein ISS70_00995 [Phycisphaerae bacterium]|nr:hypothetical protein [Phycisphaerae bacterium]